MLELAQHVVGNSSFISEAQGRLTFHVQELARDLQISTVMLTPCTGSLVLSIAYIR